jgi:hypothetical protein
MKNKETTPMLAEVKGYFKNAKEVECLADKNDIFDISEIEIYEYERVFMDGSKHLRIYDKDTNQFAKILHYQNTEIITHEQIKEIDAGRSIREVFPSVFGLEVGKWYNSEISDGSLFFIKKKQIKDLKYMDSHYMSG